MPLNYLLGPVGDMYCLSNTFRMLALTNFMWIVPVVPYAGDFFKILESHKLTCLNKLFIG